jgi:hypothetical protein
MSEQFARAGLVAACCVFVVTLAYDAVASQHGVHVWWLIASGGLIPFLHWAPLASGGLILLFLLFERGRYRPPIDPRGVEWKPTGERFIDPASGEMLSVYFNARTNERDYRPL